MQQWAKAPVFGLTGNEIDKTQAYKHMCIWSDNQGLHMEKCSEEFTGDLNQQTKVRLLGSREKKAMF